MRYYFLVVLFCLPLAVISFAEVPQLLSFQGHLTDTTGRIVPDGNYNLTFRIYDVSTGGTSLWSESHPVVLVSGGYCNVLLGSVSTLPIALFDGSDRWVAVQVGTDAEMSPRQQITSVGYAFRSASVDEVNWDEITDIPDDLLDGDDIGIPALHVSSIPFFITDTVAFIQGANMTLTQLGNTITFSSTGGGGDCDTANFSYFADSSHWAEYAENIEWENILNIPVDIADGDDIDTFIADWDSIRNMPLDMTDGDGLGLQSIRIVGASWITDSILLMEGSHIKLNQSGYTITIEAYDSMVSYWDSLRNIPPGFADGTDDDDLSDNSVGDLSDVDASGLTIGQVLIWNGTTWIPGYVDSTGYTLFADTSNWTLHVDWDSIVNMPPDIADGDNIDTMVAYWDSLRNIPIGLSDGDDIDTSIADWDSIVNIPPDIADGDDVDDADADSTNELIIGQSWNDSTNTITYTDAGGDHDVVITGFMESTTDNWVDESGDDMTGTLNFNGVGNDITTSGTEHLALMPGGNVGIGTTSPTEKLEVDGNVKINDKIYSASGNVIIVIGH